jgi:Na+-transporting methylmalonyl-CoA/oxaloacetate decarboxylase gamma subunit
MVVALLVCVVSVMSLNYFRPHKNVVVLCVAQVSFLLTSFKYILAIVLDDVAEEEREMLGWVLIVLDVCFVLGSIGCVFAVFYLLSSRVKKDTLRDEIKTKKKTRTQVKPRLTSVRTKLVNSIHAAIVHHKVTEVQKSSAMHLRTHADKVMKRKTIANRRLQQRLSNRSLRSAAHTTIIEERIVHSL